MSYLHRMVSDLKSKEGVHRSWPSWKSLCFLKVMILIKSCYTYISLYIYREREREKFRVEYLHWLCFFLSTFVIVTLIGPFSSLHGCFLTLLSDSACWLRLSSKGFPALCHNSCNTSLLSLLDFLCHPD